MRRLAVAALVALAVAGAARPAAADVTVGFFAPSAPFAGTSARQEWVSRLATHLADAVGGKGVGRVFGRARDFTAAVKAGELDVAVVDATYLAASGAGHAVLATATRGGADAATWQVVTRGGETSLVALKDKSLVCPSVGGREAEFVYQALLGGEVGKGFFARIDAASDALSAVAALGLGRADAAVIPVGIDLPAGITRVATLPAAPWPVLVAFTRTGEAVRKKVAAAAGTFVGGDVLGGFTPGGADAVRALTRRFARVERRGPMVIPSLRVAVDELVQARARTIPRIDVEALLAPPAPLPPP